MESGQSICQAVESLNKHAHSSACSFPCLLGQPFHSFGLGKKHGRQATTKFLARLGALCVGSAGRQGCLTPVSARGRPPKDDLPGGVHPYFQPVAGLDQPDSTEINPSARQP